MESFIFCAVFVAYRLRHRESTEKPTKLDDKTMNFGQTITYKTLMETWECTFQYQIDRATGNFVLGTVGTSTSSESKNTAVCYMKSAIE